MLENIVNRERECMQLYDKTKDNEYLMEMDSIAHVAIGRSVELHLDVLSFCRQNNFDTIIDIGCAYGHQSEFFRDDMKYIGINENKLNFFNNSTVEYLVGKYPCDLSNIQYNKEKTAALSVLCLTWLYDDKEDLRAQCETLRNDFKNVILYVPHDKIEYVKKYFQKSIILSEESMASLVVFQNE